MNDKSIRGINNHYCVLASFHYVIQVEKLESTEYVGGWTMS